MKKITKLKTIYRCSTSGTTLLTIDNHLVEHNLHDMIEIKTTTKYTTYEVVDILNVVLDTSKSPFETTITKEYIIFDYEKA